MAIRSRPDEVCPMCGQTLPEKNHWGLRLTPAQRILVETIQAAGVHGVSKERLFTALYGNQSRTENALAVLLTKLNKKLRTVGREVICGAYRPLRYKIVEVLPPVHRRHPEGQSA